MTTDELKMTLHNDYMKQVKNFLGGDEKRAMQFLSAVVYATMKNPKLLECTQTSLLQAFMTCAEYGLMPSTVSGESYVIPYNNKKWDKETKTEYFEMEAQFQLGYQGLVTLFYRAGVKSIIAEIVREKDDFTFENGVISHKPDPFLSKKSRGKAIGAYVVIENQQGGKAYAAMGRDDLLAHGKKFSKSFDTKFTPWKEENDPELWMWKKTVLKQASKLVPKNETINRVVDIDNQDSTIHDRLENAKGDAKALTMGALIKTDEERYEKDENAQA